MFDKLPTDYSVAVKTPDPIVVKIQPSDALIAIMVAGLFVVAAGLKLKFK
jgi:hypothetical protein